MTDVALSCLPRFPGQLSALPCQSGGLAPFDLELLGNSQEKSSRLIRLHTSAEEQKNRSTEGSSLESELKFL